MSPNALSKTVAECAQGSHQEIRVCLKDYGPFGGLVRLARLFPHGYLEASSRASTSVADVHYRKELRALLRDLDGQVPSRLSATKNSIQDARLDDIVFREVQEVCRANQRRDADLLNQLFTVYGVAKPLPRLADLVASLSGQLDLSDTVVVGHQHILGSVASQFEALWQLGLEPARTYVVGKPYSTNRLAAMYLENRGCHVRPGMNFSPLSPSEAIRSPNWYQNDNHDSLGHIFADIVNRLPEQGVSRLLVLDDGGLILSWLNRAFDSGLFTTSQQEQLAKFLVAGVEQTTFGRRLIERLDNPRRLSDASAMKPVPVGNVAETRLKLEQESLLIANSVVHEIDSWIRASSERGRHVKNLREASVGVIGFGVVGSWVCKVLQQTSVHRIIVFDSDVSHSSIARSVGYQVAHSVRELAAQCSVIIGCTGAAAGIGLTADMLQSRSILASASSGNYEFAQAFLSSRRKRHAEINPEVSSNRDASAFDWVHSIFPIDVPNGIAYVLNGGFPVNFTGAVDPIRPEEIELTRCLIVAGVATAIECLGSDPNFGGPIELATVDECALQEMFSS